MDIFVSFRYRLYVFFRNIQPSGCTCLIQTLTTRNRCKLLYEDVAEKLILLSLCPGRFSQVTLIRLLSSQRSREYRCLWFAVDGLRTTVPEHSLDAVLTSCCCCCCCCADWRCFSISVLYRKRSFCFVLFCCLSGSRACGTWTVSSDILKWTLPKFLEHFFYSEMFQL